LQDAEPRVLHDLLGDGVGRHVHPGDPEHRCLVPLEERHERGLVAAPQPFDEYEIVG
jgi:hypothetical protein